MRASKLIAKAIRLIEEYASMEWYERIRHRSEPPPPYYERMRPRRDYQRRSYWLRIRSNHTTKGMTRKCVREPFLCEIRLCNNIVYP